MNIDLVRLIRYISGGVILIVSAVSVYGLVSVLYFRSYAVGLVPALLAAALLYGLIKVIQVERNRGFYLGAPRLLMILIVLLPALSLLGQSALNFTAMDIDGRSSIGHAQNFWMVGALWLISGAAIATGVMGRSNLLAMAILGALLFLLWLGSDGLFIINYGLLSAGLGGARFSHLNTSDYAVFGLALAYGLASGWFRVIVLVAGVFVLFALGGRSALLAFTAAAVLHWIFWGQVRLASRVAGSLFLVSVLSAVFVYLAEMGRTDVAGKDVLFSQGYAADSSVVARLDQIMLGVADLGKQAVFGDPSLIVKKFDSVGGYMHNLLSAWQFYGLVFFAVLLSALFYSLRHSYVHRESCGDALSTAFVLLLIYVAISVVVAKAITFYLLWLVLGFWLERVVLANARQPWIPLDGVAGR